MRGSRHAWPSSNCSTMQLSERRLSGFCEPHAALPDENLAFGARLLRRAAGALRLQRAGQCGPRQRCLEQMTWSFLLSLLDHAFDAFYLHGNSAKLLFRNTAEHELEPWNGFIHQLDTKEPKARDSVMAANTRLSERELGEVQLIPLPRVPAQPGQQPVARQRRTAQPGADDGKAGVLHPDHRVC